MNEASIQIVLILYTPHVQRFASIKALVWIEKYVYNDFQVDS